MAIFKRLQGLTLRARPLYLLTLLVESTKLAELKRFNSNTPDFFFIRIKSGVSRGIATKVLAQRSDGSSPTFQTNDQTEARTLQSVQVASRLKMKFLTWKRIICI